MRRVISSSVIALLIIGALGIGFYYFNRYRNTSESAIHAIPADASFFIDFYPDAGNLRKIVNSYYFADSKSDSSLKKPVGSLLLMDSLLQSSGVLRDLFMSGHLLISAHVTRAADFDFLFLLSLPTGTGTSEVEDLVRDFAADPDAAFLTRNYDGVPISELSLRDGNTFTFTVTKGVFAGSFTPFLVEDAIRQQKLKKPFGGDKSFQTLFAGESIHREDKIYFRYSSLAKWMGVFTDPERSSFFGRLSSFGDWACLSIHAEKDHVSFTGITSEVDSGSFLNLFSLQDPVKILLPGILPARTAAFVYYGFSKKDEYFNLLKGHLLKSEGGADRERHLNTLDAVYHTSVRQKLQKWIGNEYALVVTEPAGINYANNILAVFEASDTLKAMAELRDLGRRVADQQKQKYTEENYLGHAIGLINLKDVMGALYGESFKMLNRLFYTRTGKYIIFSNQASSLRSFIDDYQAQHFLFKDENSNSLTKQNSKGNFCLYSRIHSCSYLFKSIGSLPAKAWLERYKGFARWNELSFLVANNKVGFKTSAELQYSQKPVSGVNLLWSAELDSVIIAGPSFVSMGNGQKGVLVQDAQLNLWLLDNTGNIRWKKTLDGPVISDFSTFDMFNNGQEQFFFNTRTHLHLLDTTGENFSGYPIRLPAPATNGAAVFDFDNTRDYRMYIACTNGKVYGYMASGKPLPGWNFSFTTAPVIDPIFHFRRNNQDILLIYDAAGQVYLLDKFGQESIHVHQRIGKNQGVPFYLDADREGNYSFVTLDTSGNLCSIMPDGFIRVHPVMEFASGSGFAMADLNNDEENDYLLNNGNQLSLYQFDSLSIFARIPGGQADPAILVFKYNGNDLKFGTWSASSGRIHLFNTSGILHKGFPVKGDRQFKLDEINNDGRKNILVSYGKEVFLYLLE